MAKHRRGGSAASPPPPRRPVREMIMWAAFGCALVPLILLWSGAGWRTSLGVGGLLAMLTAGCAVAVRLSGMSLPSPASPDHVPDHSPDDEKSPP